MIFFLSYIATPKENHQYLKIIAGKNNDEEFTGK